MTRPIPHRRTTRTRRAVRVDMTVALGAEAAGGAAPSRPPPTSRRRRRRPSRHGRGTPPRRRRGSPGCARRRRRTGPARAQRAKSSPRLGVGAVPVERGTGRRQHHGVAGPGHGGRRRHGLGHGRRLRHRHQPGEGVHDLPARLPDGHHAAQARAAVGQHRQVEALVAAPGDEHGGRTPRHAQRAPRRAWSPWSRRRTAPR